MNMRYERKECGKRIARLRKKSELTQMQAAERLNISVEHYRGIETGRRNASIELMIDIASEFGVTLDYLILGCDSDRMQIKEMVRELIEKLSELAE